MAEEKKKQTEVQYRQVNYTIIEKLWDAIAEKATEYEGKQSEFMDRNNLYKTMGTFKTDFSSYKSGKKTRISKTMVRAIEQVNYDDFSREDIDTKSWEENVKKVLLGKGCLSVKGVETEEILSIYNENADSIQKKEVLKKVEQYCKAMVNNYWSNVNANSIYDGLCIWMSLAMKPGDTKYTRRKKIERRVDAFEDISIEDLNGCDLDFLKGTIEKTTKALKKMQVIYDYRKLTEKNKK